MRRGTIGLRSLERGEPGLMAYRFSGTYEELQAKLHSLELRGEWSSLNENQKQFRHENGGIMNWYPSTGSIYFQGKRAGREVLEESVARLLADDSPRMGDGLGAPRPAAVKVQSAAAGDPSGRRSEPDTPDKQAISLGRRFVDSELIIGLVGAVGTELNKVVEILEDRLKKSSYEVHQVRISRHIIPRVVPMPDSAIDG